ncbi:MAG: PEP-CTERM sorting domain-containing protein [Thiobacillaceae bacterium]
MLGFFQKSALGLVAAAGLMMAGNAFAASYFIILKDNASNNIGCASGGFSFTKTSAGTFPTGGASVMLGRCTFVPGIANGTYSPGNLSVVVQDITTPQPQGPNVEGLTGTLQFTTTAAGDCDGTGTSTLPKTYTITFSYGGTPNPASRTYSIACAGPGNPLPPVTGVYDARNTASLPEPETLLLMLAGLAGYGLVMRRRRKLHA